MEENNMNFKGYDTEFSSYNFNTMTNEEMEECRGVIRDIKGLLEG